MVLLTSENFVKSISNLDDNVQGSYLGPAIREVQDTELISILGSKLTKKLQDLVASGDIDEDENAYYKELLDKAQYFLAYSAIVKIILICSVKLSNLGASQAEDENIRTLDLEEVLKLQSIYQTKADFYCKMLQKYILENKAHFPELSENSCNETKANLYSAASSGLFLGGQRGKKVPNHKTEFCGGGSSQGGGEGTSDYNELSNKPKINSVTLKGDKSLDELGIAGKEWAEGEFEEIREEIQEIKTNAYKSLEKKADYLYQVEYDGLDYEYAKEYFDTIDFEIPYESQCSAVREGNFVGRNYDWLDNYDAVFAVHTPKAQNHKEVWGIAGSVPELTIQKVESRDYSPFYKLLPFFLQDGVNEDGLFAEINMVPKPETPNNNINPTGEVEDRICSVMLVRYILDNFSSVSAAVDYLTQSVQIYNPDFLLDKGYEVHYLLADDTDTVVLEFINGKLEVINQNKITNFHIYGVDFNEDGSVYTAVDAMEDNYPSYQGIEDYGSGLERWNILNASDVADKGDMEQLMANVKFSKAYTLLTNVWYSEFVGGDITVDTPADNQDLDDRVLEYRQKYEERTKDNPETWLSVHSSIYDLENRKLYVKVQERMDEHTFSFESEFATKEWVESEVDRLENEIMDKQDTLTAGDGITIEDNVISCTVSGGDESNYVIVDDLSAITNPYEGLKAYVRPQYVTYTATGFTPTTDEDYITHIRRSEDPGDNIPIYISGENFFWDWENNGSINDREWWGHYVKYMVEKHLDSAPTFYIINLTSGLSYDAVDSSKAVVDYKEIAVETVPAMEYTYKAGEWVMESLYLENDNNYPEVYLNIHKNIHYYPNIFIKGDYTGNKYHKVIGISNDGNCLGVFYKDSGTDRIVTYGWDGYRLYNMWNDILMHRNGGIVQENERGLAGGYFYTYEWSLNDGFVYWENERLAGTVVNGDDTYTVSVEIGADGEWFRANVRGVDRWYREIREWDYNPIIEEGFVGITELDYDNNILRFKCNVPLSIDTESPLMQQYNEEKFNFEKVSEGYELTTPTKLETLDGTKIYQYTLEDIRAIVNEKALEVFYLNGMTQAERAALFTELMQYKTGSTSVDVKGLSKYIFYLSAPNKDEFLGPLRVYLARYDASNKIDFTGMFASRADNKYWKVHTALRSTGALDNADYAEYDKYTAGSGISISNNVISSTGVNSETISSIWTGTQAQYNALEEHSNNVLYIING